ncbi:MAG: glycoside hydrolase family 30 beta sandwich domain-containing protein [Flavobacterium sp.]
MVTVVMNQSDKEVTYNLMIASEKTVATIPPHSIQTLLY